TADTLAQFRTELRAEGRFDLDEHILRAEYTIPASGEARSDVETAALHYLESSEAKFGIEDPARDLVISAIRQGHNSSHITMRQVYSGIPVFNREVKVN